MKRWNLWMLLSLFACMAWGQVPAMVGTDAGERQVQLSPDENKKLRKTLKVLQRKALAGNAEAQYGLAYMHFLSKEYVTAAELFEEAARKRHAEAQQMLGYLYAEGLGVSQSYREAVKWWTKAAGQGNAMAQTFLGYCYLNGDGVAQDQKTAVDWFIRASEQNDLYALLALGRCYEQGEGVGQDVRQAARCYEKAMEAPVRALAFLQEFPTLYQCDPFVMGTMLDRYEAKLRLAAICGLGKGGVEKDVPKACALLEDDAAKYANAQIVLGEIYYEDGADGTPGSYEKAVANFTKAKTDVDDDWSGIAAFFLSKCYRFGRGVPQDVAKADALQQEASAKGYDEAKSLDDLLEKVFTHNSIE